MAFTNWINYARECVNTNNRQDFTVSFYTMREDLNNAQLHALANNRCLDTEFGSWLDLASSNIELWDTNSLRAWLDDAQNRVNTYGDVSSVNDSAYNF